MKKKALIMLLMMVIVPFAAALEDTDTSRTAQKQESQSAGNIKTITDATDGATLKEKAQAKREK